MDSITIDRSGRIVIPKSVRNSMRLEAGDSLEIETSLEEITLRPVRAVAPLVKEQGIWVFRSGGTVSREAANRLLDEAREERIRDLSR